MRPVLALAILSAAVSAMAQKDMTGSDQFPQFRNLGGLSGNLVPVGPDGKPDYFGALSLSTPVAYTYANWHASGAYGLMAFDMSFKAPGSENRKQTNGTAQFMGGLPGGAYGHFMISYMVLSHLGDGAFNAQWMPFRQSGKVRWAVGVQDIRGNGGSAGENVAGDGDTSTSFFGVATYAIDPKTHVSLGTGTRRFRGVFGNISTNITDDLKGTVEYDTFNWNVGLSYRVTRLMKLQGESYDKAPWSVDLNAFLGVIRGKYLFWGLGISF